MTHRFETPACLKFEKFAEMDEEKARRIAGAFSMFTKKTWDPEEGRPTWVYDDEEQNVYVKRKAFEPKGEDHELFQNSHGQFEKRLTSTTVGKVTLF